MLDSSFRVAGAVAVAFDDRPSAGDDNVPAPLLATLTAGSSLASSDESAPVLVAAVQQSTAVLAQAVQQTVTAAVRAQYGSGDQPQADRASASAIEIATQVSSILVLSQGLLNSGLVAWGDQPFDLFATANDDLDRLDDSRRLVTRLVAAGADAGTASLATSRIDAALARLDILTGIIAGKIDDVKSMIDAIGLDSDIDDFSASMSALRERIADMRDAANAGAGAAPSGGPVAGGAGSSGPLQPAAIGAMADAAAFQDRITAIVEAVDSAASAGAQGGDAAPNFLDAATTAGASDVPSFAPPAATSIAAVALPILPPVQRWIDDLAREYGSLDAAAAAFGFADGERLTASVQAIAARTFDPLGDADSHSGGQVNYLFSDDSRVFSLVRDEVWRHMDDTRMKSLGFDLLDDLLANLRAPAPHERVSEETDKTRLHRRPLADELVIGRGRDDTMASQAAVPAAPGLDGGTGKQGAARSLPTARHHKAASAYKPFT